MKKLFLMTFLAFASGIIILSIAQTTYTPATRNYPDITQNGWFWMDDNFIWDLTRCDLVISYQLDMSGYVPPMWATAWSSVGAGDGAWGWMSSGAPAAAETNPNNLDIDDKLNLGAPGRYDEASYDATGPETLVTPPIGNPWANFGVWFDRDGVDPWQALMWGMVNGDTYNTGGIYDVVVTFHAINPTLGTMFATVNGQQTGFYDTWKNAAPDYFPVGKSISGDLTRLRIFVSISGANVKVLDLQASGCGYLTAIIDIKPGSYPNPINTGEQGLLPVAILGSSTFDVTTINPTTIEIGGVTLATRGSAKAPKLSFSFEDTNGDGITDMIAFFDVPTLASSGIFDGNPTHLELIAYLYDGTQIKGKDGIYLIQ